MPTQPFLEELETKDFSPWSPTVADAMAKRQDEELINDALSYRSRFEGQWSRHAKLWNLVQDPLPAHLDGKVSNVLLPIVRMIAQTEIIKLCKGLPGYVYKPRQNSDLPKAELWTAASEHIDIQTNMAAQHEEAITNFVVLGNAGLEDRVSLPIKMRRVKVNGEWDYRPSRDFSRPKIETIARSPWEFGFLSGTRNPNHMTPVFWRDFYSYNLFVQEFANVYDLEGKPKYINCNSVKPGTVCDFTSDGKTTYRDEPGNQGVLVITVQDPVRDIFHKYANGVLIFDIPLHEYCRIQETTLSILRNNHVYDTNYQTTAAYGVGEAHLLEGLNALYQAIGNLNIDNYKLANTNLISTRGGAAAFDMDVDYLNAVVIDQEAIVSPMGTVRLGDYQQFKQMIDEWCIWTTKVNFQQLIGDSSKTAFELQQRIEAQDEGLEFKIKKLENDGLKKHGRIRLCFILSDMTVEEYQELDEAESTQVADLIKKGVAPTEDYEFENGLPTKRKVRQKIRLKNRKVEEELKDSKRTINGLSILPGEGDGEVTVVPEYFWPVEYNESGAVPDVEVVGKTMHNNEKSLKFQKIQFLVNYARQRIAESANFPDTEAIQTDFEGRKLDSMLVKVMNIPEEEVNRSGDGNPKSKALDDTIKMMKELQKSATLPPPANAQTPETPVAVSNVDSQGFGSYGDNGAQPTSPVASLAG